jgi:hypothetical protein
MRRLSRCPLLPVIVALMPMVCAGCRETRRGAAPIQPRPQAQPPWFVEKGSVAGIDFINDPGPAGSFFMPQSMGNGAALFDFDQDGRLDLYLLNGAGPASASVNRLYHQEPDGRFRDVSAGSGVDVAGFGSGVAVGDVTNDGLPDLFVSEYGGMRLFINDGGGRFHDATESSGLGGRAWGSSSSFVDFDRDGWLDLVVVNYVALDPASSCHAPDGTRDFCAPAEFPAVAASLFSNRGSGSEPRFEDVTLKSGLAAVPGAGLGVLCADFDGDDWDDIFVANDQQPNRLWINRHDGTFADEAVVRGVAVNVIGATAANMGVAWGDVDGDGLADLFVTHLEKETHTLWKQGPRGSFLDQSAAAGLVGAERSTGFGTVLADFDLDGDLDLAWVSGRVVAGAPAAAGSVPPFWLRYAQRNALLENDGSGRFRSISADNPAFCGTANVARPLCAGDIDNDGDVDLVAATTAGRILLLDNVAPRRGHWLTVRAVDPTLKRDSIGAVVTIAAGDRTWQRQVQPGSSYLASHDPRVHFGLGNADAVDALLVRWPDGVVERFPGGAVDRSVVLRRGEGRTKTEAEP